MKGGITKDEVQGRVTREEVRRKRYEGRNEGRGKKKVRGKKYEERDT